MGISSRISSGHSEHRITLPSSTPPLNFFQAPGSALTGDADSHALAGCGPWLEVRLSPRAGTCASPPFSLAAPLQRDGLGDSPQAAQCGWESPVSSGGFQSQESCFSASISLLSVASSCLTAAFPKVRVDQKFLHFPALEASQFTPKSKASSPCFCPHAGPCRDLNP